ncbi:MAG: hypothetical protein JWN40_3133 [Phycisphaerales bacterium]|nr:hypothetical protein [Phycisphaerales bacterium]
MQRKQNFIFKIVKMARNVGVIFVVVFVVGMF